MAYKGPADAGYVLIGAANIAPNMETLRIKKIAVLDERNFLGKYISTICDTGQRRAELAMSGVLNSPDTDAVGDTETTGKVVSALLSGNVVAAGDSVDFYGFQRAMVSGLELTVDPEKVDSLTPEFAIVGEFNVGTVVAPHATRTAGTNTDTVYVHRRGGAVSGGHAYVHVTSYTANGASALTIKVRHSAGHVTFADHTTLTVVTATGATVTALAAASLEAHLSVSWAWTGGTSPTADWFCGVAVD